MLAIPNYEPTFFDKADTFFQVFGDELSKIIGCTLEDYWLMWDKKDDVWFSDGPVILKIANRQFEFTAFDEEFSLTLNEIDLNQDLEWYGTEENNLLVWNSKSNADINNLIGRKITDINIIAYNNISEVIFDKVNPENVGRIIETGFILHGIEFEFEKSHLFDNNNHLQIFNAINENGIRTTKQEVDKQYQKITILKSAN